ncbi:hypothetical protein RJ641_034164 [Dillenia turbinata]|uniref:C3H1-type domain-containing protein n=1 Tax=Dillenia turbinata TaxID=194707 RepID=A0AAN8VNN4_9MAGN
MVLFTCLFTCLDECPFVHPSENARTRDPRNFHYNCVPCPDFKKGTCWRGDMCDYAHRVFECLLHPTQYKTRLCKDGTSCMHHVCFFDYTMRELWPHRSPLAHPLNPPPLLVLLLICCSYKAFVWITLSSFCLITISIYPTNGQTGHLLSSLKVRDICVEKLDMLQDFEMQQQQLLNDFSCFSHQQSIISLIPLDQEIHCIEYHSLFYPSTWGKSLMVWMPLLGGGGVVGEGIFGGDGEKRLLFGFLQSLSNTFGLDGKISFCFWNPNHMPKLHSSSGLLTLYLA